MKEKLLKIVYFCSTLFVFIFPLISAAQTTTEPRKTESTVHVMAEATVTAEPDQAQVLIGVVTQASTARVAGSQNAQKLDAVIGAIKKIEGLNPEIKTISYSLTPNYTYPKEGGQPVLSGYTASNTVQVTTDKLDQVGKVLDTALQSGANNIDSLRFFLKDETRIKNQALKEAAIKARSKADALASALGLKIVRVVSAEETGSTVIPMDSRAMMKTEMAMDAPTPVEPGTVETRASVSLTVEVQ